VNNGDREDLLFLYAAGALEETERDEIEAWIASGAPESMAQLAAAMQEVALLGASRPPIAPPAALLGRLRARIDASPAGEARALPAVPRRGDWRAALGTTALAAGIAGLLAAGVVGGLVYRAGAAREAALRAELAASEDELAQLRADLDATRADAADVHEEIAELETRHRELESHFVLAEKTIMVLSSDEMQSLALTGTSALPSAHGRVFWDWKNWYCYLHAEGVTPNPQRIYAMWLFTDDGNVISVGTFHADAKGEAIFLAPVPHDIGHVIRAGVSIEPDEDLGTRPRGEVVMVGS
jgi:anti-sigma-K factor RskA